MSPHTVTGHLTGCTLLSFCNISFAFIKGLALLDYLRQIMQRQILRVLKTLTYLFTELLYFVFRNGFIVHQLLYLSVESGNVFVIEDVYHDCLNSLFIFEFKIIEFKLLSAQL